MSNFFKGFDVISECREARLGLWSCPPFLFIILGCLNIIAILASYLFASRYVEEPELAALVVIAVSIVIFVIGNFIIHGFTKIAEANRIKTEFISIVSHQLRSPLSIFKWVLDAMRHEPSPSEKATSYLSILRENTEKMIQLVNMLLEVSRIDAGRLTVHSDPVRLEALSEDILRSYEPLAAASGVQVQFAAPRGLDPVRGDREKLKMVIQNLVDNAIRYSRQGGRVAVSIIPNGPGWVEWRIQDSGLGIPKDEQRYIFQKFYRSASITRADTQGSGLGLYIARSVVIALGGVIGFESEEGRGTTFWYRLPVYH